MGIAVPVNIFEWWVGVVFFFAFLAIKIFAFVTSLLYSSESYLAADKLTKATWTIVLGVSIILQVVPLPGMSIVNLVFVVASCVFLADVRPALAGLRRR